MRWEKSTPPYILVSSAGGLEETWNRKPEVGGQGVGDKMGEASWTDKCVIRVPGNGDHHEVPQLAAMPFYAFRNGLGSAALPPAGLCPIFYGKREITGITQCCKSNTYDSKLVPPTVFLGRRGAALCGNV